MTITAIMGAKGGIGKSFLTLALGIHLAARGASVAMLDLDGNPGLTELFLMLEMAQGHSERFHQELADAPQRLTIQRLLLQPTLGIDDIALEFPVAAMLLRDLPHVVRDASCRVDPRTIVASTLATYAIDPEHIGQLILVPNAGSFQGFIQEVIDAAARDTSRKPELLLRQALDAVQRTLRDQGKPPLTHILIDTPGDRSILTQMAAFAADQVIVPFQMTKLSLLGLVNTKKDLAEVRRRRAQIVPESPGPTLLPAILNRYVAPQPHAIDWIAQVAQPTLERARIDLCPIFVPEDPDAGLYPDQLGVVPFAYNPLSPAMRALGNIAQEVLHHGA